MSSCRRLSVQTLRRMPRYMNFLKSLPSEATHVSSAQIAEAVGLGDVQVRKDLSAVSNCGRPKTGYEVTGLKADIVRLLTCDEPVRFCLVGMGNLGMALAQYSIFADYGLTLAAAFDKAQGIVGQSVGGVEISHVSSMKEVCQRENIRIGVIAVPSEHAQDACDALVNAGVLTLWNFASVHLSAPKAEYIENMNMAAQLGILSRHLRLMRQKGAEGERTLSGQNRKYARG